MNSAMEEISDRTIDKDSAEFKILYSKGIDLKSKNIDEVQNNIVDRVALFIVNYYMINEFVFPKKDGDDSDTIH
jgi:hypothetical protein